jgi:hypothetical protein
MTRHPKMGCRFFIWGPKTPKKHRQNLTQIEAMYYNFKVDMKKTVLSIIIVAVCALAACKTTDYTGNVSGTSDRAAIAVKDFVTLGIVTVQTTEIHHSGPLGLNKKVEGSKITYADLMQEAAKLEADDIFNVIIDMHANYPKGAFDWLTGWTRVYTHTGTALAIKYTDKLDNKIPDSQLSGIPKAPEPTSAVNAAKSLKR